MGVSGSLWIISICACNSCSNKYLNACSEDASAVTCWLSIPLGPVSAFIGALASVSWCVPSAAIGGWTDVALDELGSVLSAKLVGVIVDSARRSAGPSVASIRWSVCRSVRPRGHEHLTPSVRHLGQIAGIAYGVVVAWEVGIPMGGPLL